jgi:hypothetical protein
MQMLIALGAPVSDPRKELFKAFLRISEDLSGLAAIAEQRSVKRFFRDVDSEE